MLCGIGSCLCYSGKLKTSKRSRESLLDKSVGKAALQVKRSLGLSRTKSWTQSKKGLGTTLEKIGAGAAAVKNFFYAFHDFLETSFGGLVLHLLEAFFFFLGKVLQTYLGNVSLI